VQRRELFDQVQAKLNSMDPLDREVLALRHFEQLGNVEVASVLGISEPAASLRYSRALRRLKDIITEVKGMTGEMTL
jgi:RNA polymerase sigma-70 factor (ECF subfamily)